MIHHQVYYILAQDPDPYPPDLTTYLASIEDKIGAESEWEMSNFDVYGNFVNAGDWMRNSAPDLAKVINAGV
jgi:hypothetical protein